MGLRLDRLLDDALCETATAEGAINGIPSCQQFSVVRSTCPEGATALRLLLSQEVATAESDDATACTVSLRRKPTGSLHLPDACSPRGLVCTLACLLSLVARKD